MLYKFYLIFITAQKVWIGFLGTTTVFILVTTAFIKIQEKMYQTSDDNSKTVGETIYSQLAYVQTIIFSQGNLHTKKYDFKLKCLIQL